MAFGSTGCLDPKIDEASCLPVMSHCCNRYIGARGELKRHFICTWIVVLRLSGP